MQWIWDQCNKSINTLTCKAVRQPRNIKQCVCKQFYPKVRRLSIKLFPCICLTNDLNLVLFLQQFVIILDPQAAIKLVCMRDLEWGGQGVIKTYLPCFFITTNYELRSGNWAVLPSTSTVTCDILGNTIITTLYVLRDGQHSHYEEEVYFGQ